jgi:DNA-binding Lrp family transcriptional regulator
MTQPPSLDALDTQLVTRLQERPRATWVALAKQLGTRPATAARRYERLESHGIVWTTAYAGPRVWLRDHLTFIEINCEPARALGIARELVNDAHAFSIECVAGRSDVIVTAGFISLSDITAYVYGRVAALPGVTVIRTHIATSIFTDGSRWRLRGGDEQVTVPPDAGYGDPDADALDIDLLDRRLIAELGCDARTPLAELSQSLGIGISTVRRRLEALISSHSVLLRCDVARTYTSAPILVNFWGSVPGSQIRDVGMKLSKLPRLRVCAALTGEQNVLFSAWLTSASDILRLETLLAKHVPSLRIDDRSVSHLQLKLLGHRLDEAGRNIGGVPMEYFRPPESN